MKDILMNVLFILVVLFMTLLLIEWKGKKSNKNLNSLFIFIPSLVTIIFCMSFSISLNDQYYFDLRAIPFIIGGLFGGPLVTIGLYVSIIIYRLFLGAQLGFFGAVINYGILTILLCYLFTTFKQAGLKKKAMLTLFIVIFHILLSRVIFSYLFFSNIPLQLFIQSSIIKLVTILILLYIIERISKNYQLRAKMEDLERKEIVSHLSASISHEVRNGLTGVKGFLQLLNRMETDPEKLEYFRIALSELSRTENIIRDFLTFAKPAPEKIANINMMLLIQDTTEILRPLANMNSVEIKMFLSEFYIVGDERIIQQSFLNIFKNAIEAMPDGGVLEIHMNQNEDKHVITIKDTGIGMNNEQIERLGSPYFTTKGQKGTGLGMMVSFRVIEDLNGSIKVHSKVGEGTTFIVTLPKNSLEKNLANSVPFVNRNSISQ